MIATKTLLCAVSLMAGARASQPEIPSLAEWLSNPARAGQEGAERV